MLIRDEGNTKLPLTPQVLLNSPQSLRLPEISIALLNSPKIVQTPRAFLNFYSPKLTKTPLKPKIKVTVTNQHQLFFLV